MRVFTQVRGAGWQSGAGAATKNKNRKVGVAWNQSNDHMMNGRQEAYSSPEGSQEYYEGITRFPRW